MERLRREISIVLFFLGAIFWMTGQAGLWPLGSSEAQESQPKLEWMEGENTNPVIVTGHKALFQVLFIDESGRYPDNIPQVWIDADGDGEFGEDEKKDLAENIKGSVGNTQKLYYTILAFDDDKQVQEEPYTDFTKLPQTFTTKFCFYFEINGEQVIGDGDEETLNPADPNNQLLVLGLGDEDEDGVIDAEEGAALLPGTYGKKAYSDSSLATLLTPGGQITMKIDKGKFRDIQIMPEDDPNRPERSISDLEFPYGFVYFRIEELTKTEYPGNKVKMDILFPAKITSYAEFWRYYDQTWNTPIEHNYSKLGGDNFWRYDDNEKIPPQIERQSVYLYLIDNNPLYDSCDDEKIIEDPLGLGVPKESGAGKCFLRAIQWFLM